MATITNLVWFDDTGGHGRRPSPRCLALVHIDWGLPWYISLSAAEVTLFGTNNRSKTGFCFYLQKPNSLFHTSVRGVWSKVTTQGLQQRGWHCVYYLIGAGHCWCGIRKRCHHFQQRLLVLSSKLSESCTYEGINLITGSGSEAAGQGVCLQRHGPSCCSCAWNGVATLEGSQGVRHTEWVDLMFTSVKPGTSNCAWSGMMRVLQLLIGPKTLHRTSAKNLASPIASASHTETAQQKASRRSCTQLSALLPTSGRNPDSIDLCAAFMMDLAMNKGNATAFCSRANAGAGDLFPCQF